ncbi:YchJ family metal-binding protein [Candidatus Protochlamydia sp. W-9]|uniref:YchJ family metal-binding protein n=1 Tax=Candidatus Protochlamydia sp. W-9 TaxID=1785087 RepID=UPI00096AB120|nr:YchJ family metal-binding protein [Candidatus Protochlamydia sp. W-9]
MQLTPIIYLADYIIQTTHPKHPHFRIDKHLWAKEILLLCHHTKFRKLEILDFLDGKEEVKVTFIAYLQKGFR